MSIQRSSPQSNAAFDADEPVIESHPLLADGEWNLTAWTIVTMSSTNKGACGDRGRSTGGSLVV
ncbi:hypothetical protein ACH47B_29435 [Rhodococcus sp. NPDC019627]|uniref:hypothetical protein n=1 Tax=unclassified Rhodococcus (in: high G+C Gram-positive bacteria) TaxID=192944 RepID=UPI00340A9E4B